MTELPPLYIFDIDGTMALLDDETVAILRDKSDQDRYKKFQAVAHRCEPHPKLLRIFHDLHRAGADIWFMTGRYEVIRDITIEWLTQHTLFTTSQISHERLIMRDNKDKRQDWIIKEEWLHNMLDVDRERLVGVFEDRARVCAMWRKNNVVCFHITEGDY